MSVIEGFGRLLCKCDKCQYVWLAVDMVLPDRCGNRERHCRHWNIESCDNVSIKRENKAHKVNSKPVRETVYAPGEW